MFTLMKVGAMERAARRHKSGAHVHVLGARLVVEISRCRAPLHRSTTHPPRHAVDVELYSSTALSSSTALQRSTLYILYTLPQTASKGPLGLYY